MSDDDNIIRLPLPKDSGVWDVTNQRMVRRCEGNIHVFAKTPGNCQCGENWWDGEVPKEQTYEFPSGA